MARTLMTLGDLRKLTAPFPEDLLITIDFTHEEGISIFGTLDEIIPDFEKQELTFLFKPFIYGF